MLYAWKYGPPRIGKCLVLCIIDYKKQSTIKFLLDTNGQKI